MNAWKKIILLVAVAWLAWLAVSIYDIQTIKKGMPPGYYLECDGEGRFRPCRNAPLYWRRGPGTKAQAIRRAWRQYYYVPEQEPKDNGNWKPCSDP